MADATFIRALTHIVAESAPYLVLGFVAAGLLRALIPQERVRTWLGGEGWRSVLRASLIGVPLPLCSCSVIPAATGLRQNGAGRAATTAFLISTPETGVDSISLTYALMDPLMTVARPVAAFITAMLTGSVVGALSESEDPHPVQNLADAGDDCCTGPRCGADREPGPPRRGAAVMEGLRYAFGPLLDDLALWLISGFILAAAVTAIIPEGFFAAYSGGWLSSLLMMLLATPVYICASAATPVAAAMVMKGLDPGAAMVFLLVGPATNVTTILVVFRFLGRRVLVAYLIGVTVCALAFGAAINHLYAAGSTTPSFAVGSEEATGFSIVQLVATILLVVVLAARGWRWVSAPPSPGSEAQPDGMLR